MRFEHSRKLVFNAARRAAPLMLNPLHLRLLILGICIVFGRMLRAGSPPAQVWMRSLVQTGRSPVSVGPDGTIYSSSSDGTNGVVALDGTGKVLWAYPDRTARYSSPVIGIGGELYATTSDRRLVCLVSRRAPCGGRSNSPRTSSTRRPWALTAPCISATAGDPCTRSGPMAQGPGRCNRRPPSRAAPRWSAPTGPSSSPTSMEVSSASRRTVPDDGG